MHTSWDHDEIIAYHAIYYLFCIHIVYSKMVSFPLNFSMTRQNADDIYKFFLSSEADSAEGDQLSPENKSPKNI